MHIFLLTPQHCVNKLENVVYCALHHRTLNNDVVFFSIWNMFSCFGFYSSKQLNTVKFSWRAQESWRCKVMDKASYGLLTADANHAYK